jgi:hypothetical protein
VYPLFEILNPKCINAIARSACDEAIHLPTSTAVRWIASLALAMTDKTLAFLAFLQTGGGRPIAASKPKFI